MINRTYRRPGFTLIEALISMVMLAIVLPVAMQGISLAMRLSLDARRRGEAAMLARAKLDELTATNAWQNGQMAGDFGPDWPAYHWSATAQPWINGVMDELTIQVLWTNRQGEQSVTLGTLVNPGTSTGPSTTLGSLNPAPVSATPEESNVQGRKSNVGSQSGPASDSSNQKSQFRNQKSEVAP